MLSVFFFLSFFGLVIEGGDVWMTVGGRTDAGGGKMLILLLLPPEGGGG